MSTKEELNLTPAAAKISDQLLKKLVIDESGAIDPDKKLHLELLPEGVTAESIKLHENFYNDLLAGAAHATGTLAQDFLKKHKKVDEVHMDKLQVGRGAVRVNYKRTAEVSGIGGVKSTKHGWITAKFTTSASGAGGAQFGRIRQHFAEQGTVLFG